VKKRTHQQVLQKHVAQAMMVLHDLTHGVSGERIAPVKAD
jgi:hypothetical protein